MGFFGLGKKKVWDEERSNENKRKCEVLFNQVVEDHEGYTIRYAYTTDVKTMNYVLARKTTYLYGSYILGYRKKDMSIVLIETSPELDGCGEPKIFKKGEIKKAKNVNSAFCIYHAGGIMAGYTQFYLMDEYDDDYFAYIHQPGTIMDFEDFWNEYRR